MKKKLTPKQAKFVAEYLIDLNATQAAIRAGYAKRSAETTASRMLRNAKVQKALEVALEQQKQRTEITADWVLKRLKEESAICEQGSARIKALELLGKHLGMFKDRIDITSKDEAIQGFKIELVKGE